MKLSFVFLALASAQEKAEDVLNSDFERNRNPVNQLKFLTAAFFQAKTGQGYVSNYANDLLNKYFRYGCHCYITNKEEMIERVHGRPVDSLDNKCKAYRECLMCVGDKHGDECLSRSSYRWQYSEGMPIPVNPAGSCGRDLFECNFQLVKGIFAERDTFNEDYHHSLSTIGFNREDKDNFCPSNAGTPIQHQCCGGYDSPWHWISMNNNRCCANGESGVVVGANDQC